MSTRAILLRRGWLVLFLGALLGWVGGSGVASWCLMRRVQPREAQHQPKGIVAQDVRLRTTDGIELGAWWAPAQAGHSVVVLLHGIHGTRLGMAAGAAQLARRGSGYLAVTLRAHGDSQGEVIDFGWSSRRDLESAIAFVEEHQPGVPIVVLGQSLGAVTAIYAAPELGTRVAGYVLEAPYLTLEKACRDRLRARLPGPLAEIAYAGLHLWSSLLLDVDVDTLRPVDFVARMPLTTPVLFVAGSRDVEAPSEDVRTLCARSSAISRYVELEGRDHKGLCVIDAPHLALWSEFLDDVEH